MTRIVAELYGGPKDGHVEKIPHLQEQILIPPTAVWASCVHGTGSAPTDDNPPGALVYELVRDCNTRQPHLNGAGHHRYQYTGTR